MLSVEIKLVCVRADGVPKAFRPQDTKIGWVESLEQFLAQLVWTIAGSPEEKVLRTSFWLWYCSLVRSFGGDWSSYRRACGFSRAYRLVLADAYNLLALNILVCIEQKSKFRLKVLHDSYIT